MPRSLVKFSESEASNHTPSLADFTTTMSELKFSVHTGGVSSETGDRPGKADHPERLAFRNRSLSGFFENDRHTPTGLAGYLRDRGLRRIFLAGLATDFCVHYSAVDARRLGFDTLLVEAGCRAIDLAGSLDAAWAAMAAAGVQRVYDLATT